jgi:DNA polymerase
MTKRVYIDFESRSQCDIWSSGAWVYSQHPTTEILCLCLAIDDGGIINLALNAPGATFIAQLISEGAEFHAHNAFFERAMWQNILTPRHGFPPIPLRQWRCTAAKASAHALPKSLEKAAQALECKHQKDMTGSKMMKFLASSTGPIDPDKLERLIEYCKNDVEVEREIDKKLPDLDPREQRIWFLDQHINDTGVRIDVEACKQAVHCIAEETTRLTARLTSLSGGEIKAGTQTAAIKRFLEAKGLDLPDLTKKTVKDALAGAEEGVQKILILRQQLSLTSNAKYQAFLDCCSMDGRVRDTLVYHGASTGRWTGKLVQLQNLAKPGQENFDNQGPIEILKNGGYETMSLLYGDDLLNTLSSSIRGMLIPTQGHEMFITDFAAIEARVVMWLAGEEVGIKMFEAGDKDPSIPDIYVETARRIFRNNKLLKKDKKERQVGKTTVLGCGFNMGPPKFQVTCDKYGIDLGPKNTAYESWGETIMLSQLALDSVFGYRDMFKKVVKFWYDLELGCKRAIQGSPQQIGKVVCYVDKDFLRIRLPAGRTLAYHRAKVEGDKISFLAADPVTKRYVPEQTFGGKICENVVQAVARDLMADAMLQAASLGFRVLFTVHDELVLEALRGTKTEEDVLKIVRTVPSWAAGCPVNAECEKVLRYKK